MAGLIPRPLSERTTGEKEFIFHRGTVWAGECLDASMLSFWRERFTGLLGPGGGAGPADEIALGLSPGEALPGSAEQGAEAYRLEVSERSVRITAREIAGLIWGLQTLWQLMAPQAGSAEIAVGARVILDAPRFGHRGLMLDVARHFFPVETVLRLLDAMSLLKLNRFHWHLTDEQGWRIEIKRYPRLTGVGCMRRETRGDGKPHGGFYSREDIAQVVRYAGLLGIEVIPEIDLPGHFGAAIAAYQGLSCRKEPIEVRTVFGIFPEIACAGSESTFEFLQGVLEEVCELFPGRYVHLGGDEIPLQRWRECPACLGRMKSEGLEKAGELRAYMMNRLAAFLRERGKTAICWNDSIAPGGVDGSVAMQYWMGGRNEKACAAEMNGGRPTVVSAIGSYYYDYPYGITGLRKAYGPVQAPKGAAASAALGVEAALWTEYIDNEALLQQMLFPRLTAAAERAWSQEDVTDFKAFAARLPALEAALKRFGIQGAPLSQATGTGVAACVRTLGFLRNAFRGIDGKMLLTILRTSLGREDG